MSSQEMHRPANEARRPLRFGDGDLVLNTIVEETIGSTAGGASEKTIIETTLFFSRDGTDYALQISRKMEEYEDPIEPQDYDTSGLMVPFIDPRLVIQVMGLPTERILELAVVIPTEE